MEKRRVNVRAIIYKGTKSGTGKLFLVRQYKNDGILEADFYATPGGGLNFGESLKEGLKREIIEELGVEPVIGRLLFVQQFKSSRSDTEEELEFFYHIENVGDFYEVDLLSTTHGKAEIAEYGLYDYKKVNLLPKFLKNIDIGSYVDEVREVVNFVDL